MTNPRNEAAARVRLLVLDCDGVLTDGSITYAQSTHGDCVELKSFHVRDGLGLRIWLGLGLHAAIVTGRGGDALRKRAAELGIEHLMEGVTDKRAALEALCSQLGVSPAETAAMGDDWPDLPMLNAAGYAIAPADAHAEVKHLADLVTDARGGRGAVREAIEHLLKARGTLADALGKFEHGPTERSL